MRLCVAIPVFNEEEVLPEVVARVGRVLDGIPGGPHSMLFVDDGSLDRSLAILKEAAQRDPRIRILSFSRNFGHQVAVTAALDHAVGDAVVLMDADLQDSPEAIPRLLEMHEKGFDVVFARRTDRKENVFLRAAYFTFYRIAASLASTPLPVDSGDFSLLSRRVVEALRGARERSRYVRGLRAWVGFRQAGVEIERAKRAAGQPKYSMLRLMKLALDGVFAFSVVPLRLAAVTGLLVMIPASAYVGYALWAKLVWHHTPQGFTALIASIVFFAGLQLLFLGVIGEYVGRIYEEVKARPLYVVRESIGGDGAALSPEHR
jgi:dolichol-phosphate mannosyltransferase